MDLLLVLMCIGVLIGILTLSLLIWVKTHIQNLFIEHEILTGMLTGILNNSNQIKKDVIKIKRRI